MRKLLALLTLVQVGLLCGCGGGGGYGGGGTTPPPGVVCSNINASLAQQLQNPAILFSADNNGVLVQMPAVGAGGAATAPGALVFGIGTQSNNALGTATVLTEDPSSGFISALYKSTTYPDGYLDSGSNGIFLNDSTFPTCASPLQSWFCPASTMAESATLTGQNSATATANFSISNAQTTFNGNSGFTAFSDVGGPTSDTAGLDLGMPFFYGRNVFIGIENHTSPGGTGPYFAFSDLTTAIPAAGAPNVEAITVNSGPTALPQPAVNTAYTSVKVCVPGTTTCQTIDNIEVDTGSIGLRIVSSALTITLPAEKDGSGHPMAECQKFADGTSS
ncbi:MAG TPA: DUF3443 family protein, partial [Candidatus Dormibacteraeota bacterium]|nr:DUF3443 family protein [Candidatus Dormibacteraeota bacterium]